MGTCFGASSNEDKLQRIERTISQSTNFTSNSSASEQTSIRKSQVKRVKHQNKRSHISYFHDNPLLKPLKNNKLFNLRKPQTAKSMDGSLQLIKEVPECEDIQVTRNTTTQIMIKPKDMTQLKPRMSSRKQRSYSTHLSKAI